MLFAVVLVVVLVVMLVVIYIYVNDYKNDYKNYNYKLQCIIPSQSLYVNNYKHNYKPNYKLQYIFSSQYPTSNEKIPMMFSITIPTCNCKTSWVPMMLCQRWYNITGGFSTCHTGVLVFLQQSQPKSKTESTSGSTKWWLVTAKKYYKSRNLTEMPKPQYTNCGTSGVVVLLGRELVCFHSVENRGI